MTAARPDRDGHAGQRRFGHKAHGDEFNHEGHEEHEVKELKNYFFVFFVASYWSHGGKQLFYQNGRLFVVAVNTDRNFTVGNPSPTLTQLLEGAIRFDAQSGLASARNYDLASDGNRVLGTADETPLATAASRYIEVVVNWVEELKARVPPK